MEFHHSSPMLPMAVVRLGLPVPPDMAPIATLIPAGVAWPWW